MARRRPDKGYRRGNRTSRIKFHENNHDNQGKSRATWSGAKAKLVDLDRTALLELAFGWGVGDALNELWREAGWPGDRFAMQTLTASLVSSWRITEMETWDADYFDMEAPAHITIDALLPGVVERLRLFG